MVENQAEMDKLKQGNEELTEKLKQLQLENNEKSTVPDNTLNEIWASLGLLQKQIVDSNNDQLKSAAAIQQSIHGMSSKIDKILKMVKEQAERLYRLEGKQGESSSRRKLTETILILGGVTRNSSHNRMAIWDPAQNNWSHLSLRLPFLSGFGGAAYLNEEIYIFGRFSNYKMVQKLDKNLKWIVLADLNEGRHYISNSSLEMDGYIWVLGGCNGAGECLKSVERYDPEEDKWSFMPDMNHPRHFAAATQWNGKIIICGGRGIHKEILSSVECYDKESEIWTEWEDLPSPRTGHALVSYYFQLVVMGGYKREYFAVDTVLELHPPKAETSWKYSGSKMKKRAVGFPAAALDCEIFAIGGLYDAMKELSRVEILGEDDEWRNGPPLPYECRNMPAIKIPLHYANRLLIFICRGRPSVGPGVF